MTDKLDRHDLDIPTEDDINYVFDGREFENREDAALARRRKAEARLVSAARDLVADVLGSDAPERLANQFSDKQGQPVDFEVVVAELLDEANFDPRETGSARVLLGQILVQAGQRITQGDTNLDVGDPSVEQNSDAGDETVKTLDSIEEDARF